MEWEIFVSILIIFESSGLKNSGQEIRFKKNTFLSNEDSRPTMHTRGPNV
jgi:hypothetical protein